MIIIIPLEITKLTLLKDLPSNNNSIDSKDCNPNAIGLASNNLK